MNDDGLAEAIEEETDNPCAQEAADSLSHRCHHPCRRRKGRPPAAP